MNQIYLKALKTFRGSNGYIAQGQEFYTTNQDEADRLVRQGYAYFSDKSQNVNGAFVGQAAPAADSVENKQVYKTSDLERNVTQLAKPVEIKVSVAGIKPEDVNVQVVNDQEAQVAETVYVDQSGAANAQRGGYQTLATNQNYQTQNIQAQNQSNPQTAPQEFPDYYPDNYRNAINGQQTQGQPQGQEKSFQEQELEQREKQLIEELHQIQQQQEQLKQSQGGQQPSEEPVFEVRHVGGGWYDLPNGERVQGKENAQARLNDLYHSGQLQGQPQGQPQGQEIQTRQVGQAQFPNPERVRQANAQPEDGAQLNALNEGLPVDAFSSNRLTGSVSMQGSLSGGQSQGQGQSQSFQGVGGDQRGANAQFQTRNSEGQFTDGRGRSAGQSSGGNSGGQAGATTGASGSRSGGNGGGGNSSGSGANTSGNTGGNSGGGGADTSGNTGQ